MSASAGQKQPQLGGANSYSKLAMGIDNNLLVNQDKVIKKGVLYKKGNIFKRYKE
jgi:hypothetical protein